jgi:multiple sugar transport system substrate-binding protein
MWRRKWMLGVALMLSLTVGACGSEGDKGADGKRADDAGETSYAPAHLVIYSTSGWTEQAFYDRFGAIREKFPQHTFMYIQSVKGSQYPDLISAGQEIDIIWESVANFRTGPIEYKTAFDMTDLIKKHNIDVSRLNNAMVERMRAMSNGGLYALPVLNNTLSLYYNKDLFDKFGVPYPKDGMTWDEVFELNRRMTRSDGGVQYIGLSFSDSHFFAIHPIALPYADASGKATVANGQWNPIYNTFLRAAETSGYKDKVRQLNAVPGIALFRDKMEAAMFAGLANTHMTQDLSRMNWDVVQFPTYKEAPGVHPQTYPTYFGVSATSKYKDQAMEVIKYLVSDEFQMIVSRTGALPVVNDRKVLDVFAADTNFKDKNVRSALYPSFAFSAAPTEYDGVLGGIYRKYLKNLMMGEMDLNTLLRTTEEEANKAIVEFNSK